MPPELYPATFDARPVKVERSRRSNRRTATVPKGVTPVVRLVFGEISRQGLRYQDIEDFSGVRRVSLKAWRKKNRPAWESIQSVLSVLGFGFVPTPVLQVLPPNIASELAVLALRLERDLPTTFSALVDIAAEQKLLRMDADERRAVVESHRAALRGTSRRRTSANDNTPRRKLAGKAS